MTAGAPEDGGLPTVASPRLELTVHRPVRLPLASRSALPFGVLLRMPPARFTFGLAVLALSLVSVAGCRDEAPAESPARPAIPFRLDGSLRFVRADGTPITGISIEIAERDSTIRRGLMERDSIPAQVGMLFVMPRAEPQTFWMANTPRSLDIIFVGADSAIVSVAKYTTPYSSEGIPSGAPAKYVVETAAGFTDRHGIAAGDRIRWSRNPNATPAYVGGLPGTPPPRPDTTGARP